MPTLTKDHEDHMINTPYPLKTNTPYWRYSIVKISGRFKRGSLLQEHQYPYPTHGYARSNTLIKSIIEYGVSTFIGYGISNFLSNTAYSIQLMNTAYPLPLDTAYPLLLDMAYPLPLDTAYRSSGTESEPLVVHEKEFNKSPDFNLRYDQEFSEEEVAEIMAETMEQYMSKTRAEYGSGVARPKIDDKDNFELKGLFLKELRTNTFSGSDHEDANEHIEKVLEIVDLFHIPNITIDQVMLRAFPMSLTGAASRWLICTDIAKISRKRSKPDKHGHRNEKECIRAGRMLSKSNIGQPKATI
ncbi:hypothetical protein Tco_0986703 [Tanacetum coccineum]